MSTLAVWNLTDFGHTNCGVSKVLTVIMSSLRGHWAATGIKCRKKDVKTLIITVDVTNADIMTL